MFYRAPRAVVFLLLLSVALAACASDAPTADTATSDSPVITADNADRLTPSRLLATDALISRTAWEADGSRIAVNLQDETLHVWDTADGNLLHTLRTASADNPQLAMAWLPDGDTLAVSVGNVVQLHELGSEDAVVSLSGPVSAIGALAASADGTRIASGSGDGVLRLWQRVDAGFVAGLDDIAAHPVAVYALAFAPDGAVLASGGADAVIRLWDAATGESVAELVGHGDAVTALAWSSDGTRLVSSSEDESARVWDVASGETLLRLRGHNEEVTGAAISPDGSVIASSSNEGSVKLWDAASGNLLATLQLPEQVVDVGFSSDGRILAAASADSGVQLFVVAPAQ